MPKSHNVLQDELLENMGPDISSGGVVVSKEAEQYYLDVISQHYPFMGSKIDWIGVPGHFHEIVSQTEFSKSIHRFFNRVIQTEKLSQESMVVVVGDGILDATLTLPVNVLQKYLEAIVELPQHTYIVSEDVSWCACFTMEGDMDFGIWSPSATTGTTS